MSDRYFVDTNILVYRRDASEIAKQPAADAWLSRLWEQRLGCLSTQVLQEFYQVVTRRLAPGMSSADARAEVQELLTWGPVQPNAALFSKAWSIEDRFKLSWWDCLIVAAAQQADAQYLLTEDLQDGQDFDGVLVLNPFEHPA